MVTPLSGGDWVYWALTHNVFLLVSAFCYVIFCSMLFNLGVKSHRVAACGGNPIGQFPQAYFVMLAIQLIPLAVTGLVIGDLYVIATRVPTLFLVLVVYGLNMSSRSQGLFDTRYYRAWSFFWFCVVIMGTMLWVELPGMRAFVRDWETLLVYGTIAIMLIYVAGGQWSAAKQLFLHHLSGQYSLRRFSSQFVRLIGFGTQAYHYWNLPSSAPTTFGLDPIFLQGFIGFLGTIMVITMALWGIAWRLVRGKPKPQEPSLAL